MATTTTSSPSPQPNSPSRPCPTQTPSPGGPTPAPTTAASKKPQPIPWTHQETLHLIQAYQEKWYAQKRGPLKSSQWEEVAVTVAARCGYDHSHPSAKTALQCRHKMEKLRKRYRSDRQRASSPAAAAAAWQYYSLMDSLERGPLPISARPLALVQEADSYNDDEDEPEEEEIYFPNYNNNLGSFHNYNNTRNGNSNNNKSLKDEEDEGNYVRGRSRSINYILRRPTVVNRFAAASGDVAAGKRRREESEGEEELDLDEDRQRRRGGAGGPGMALVAREIRGIAERFVGLEKRKMEMMRETERWRMDMENKRMEMILSSHKKIVEAIARAFEEKEGEEEEEEEDVKVGEEF